MNMSRGLLARHARLLLVGVLLLSLAAAIAKPSRIVAGRGSHAAVPTAPPTLQPPAHDRVLVPVS